MLTKNSPTPQRVLLQLGLINFVGTMVSGLLPVFSCYSMEIIFVPSYTIRALGGTPKRNS